MKTRVLKIILCLSSVFFMGATTAPQQSFTNSYEARKMMEQSSLDKLDLQFKLYESGIEMFQSEVRLKLTLKKNPLKIVK